MTYEYPEIFEMDKKYYVVFKKTFDASPSKVFECITKKTSQWNEMIHFDQVKDGSNFTLQLDETNSSSLTLPILSVSNDELLKLEWPKGYVQFDLHSQSPISTMCSLTQVSETLSNRLIHDITNWHVALINIEQMLLDANHQYNNDDYKPLYDYYVKEMNAL